MRQYATSCTKIILLRRGIGASPGKRDGPAGGTVWLPKIAGLHHGKQTVRSGRRRPINDLCNHTRLKRKYRLLNVNILSRPGKIKFLVMGLYRRVASYNARRYSDVVSNKPKVTVPTISVSDEANEDTTKPPPMM